MDQKRIQNRQLPPDNYYQVYYIGMNNDAMILFPPKYHFWRSENYNFFPQSMSINLSPPTRVPIVCYLNTVNSHYQGPHWFIKKYQYPITNYIIKIVLSFPLWFRSTAVTGTIKIVHYKNELALRALWFWPIVDMLAIWWGGGCSWSVD